MAPRVTAIMKVTAASRGTTGTTRTTSAAVAQRMVSTTMRIVTMDVTTFT
jgi:hypothetical protein